VSGELGVRSSKSGVWSLEIVLTDEDKIRGNSNGMHPIFALK
jgi:hypothetical protein